MKKQRKINYDFINEAIVAAHERSLLVIVFSHIHVRFDNNVKNIDCWKKKFGVIDINFYESYTSLDELLDDYFGDDFDPRKYSKHHKYLDEEFKGITGQ